MCKTCLSVSKKNRKNPGQVTKPQHRCLQRAEKRWRSYCKLSLCLQFFYSFQKLGKERCLLSGYCFHFHAVWSDLCWGVKRTCVWLQRWQSAHYSTNPPSSILLQKAHTYNPDFSLCNNFHNRTELTRINRIFCHVVDSHDIRVIYILVKWSAMRAQWKFSSRL